MNFYADLANDDVLDFAEFADINENGYTQAELDAAALQIAQNESTDGGALDYTVRRNVNKIRTNGVNIANNTSRLDDHERRITDIEADIYDSDGNLIVGLNGAKGDKGDQGDRGDRGLQGLQGERGAAGTNGTDGRNGIDGITTTIHTTTVDNSYEDTAISGTTRRIDSIQETTIDSRGRYTTIFNGQSEAHARGDLTTQEELNTAISDIELTPGARGAKGDRGERGLTGAAGADGSDGADGTTLTEDQLSAVNTVTLNIDDLNALIEARIIQRLNDLETEKAEQEDLDAVIAALQTEEGQWKVDTVITRANEAAAETARAEIQTALENIESYDDTDIVEDIEALQTWVDNHTDTHRSDASIQTLIDRTNNDRDNNNVIEDVATSDAIGKLDKRVTKNSTDINKLEGRVDIARHNAVAEMQKALGLGDYAVVSSGNAGTGKKGTDSNDRQRKKDTAMFHKVAQLLYQAKGKPVYYKNFWP